ncbi:MAG TPA: hypothetical protein VJ063_18985, partial [Verrucomicrobiae bacterium]|nr:hypothetical protein [Verrucomicrobiae bacterium]
MQSSGNNDCFGNVRAIERREFYKRWGRRLVVGLVAIGLGFGGYRGYATWRRHHLARQAQDFFAKADYQSAVLVSRHLLQLDPKSVTACRIMAETAELAGREEALSWREHVTALEPKETANQIALAATALKFGQLALAHRALDAVQNSTSANVRYHQLAGTLAVAERKPAVAEAEFSAALKLEPQNDQLALNLAALQLTSADLSTREKARAELTRLATNASLRSEALRALTSDALANNALTTAENWASELRAEKTATFSDLLLYLEATHKTDHGAVALRDGQKIAEKSAGTAAALVTWMNRHALAAKALEWGLALPPEVREAHPMPLAIAETYSFLQDWTALLAWVDGKDWGPEEFLRLAVQCHALRHLTPADRSSMESQTVWAAAIKATKSRPDYLAAIARLAEGWGYDEEAAEAWWVVANGNENAKEALTALQRLYKAKSNSRGLHRVAKRALELNPNDLVAANNYASLGLLLTGDSASRRLAVKLHQKNPDNAALNTTYAFALFTEGKTTEALRAMETLKEKQLRHPAVAAYYFVML